MAMMAFDLEAAGAPVDCTAAESLLATFCIASECSETVCDELLRKDERRAPLKQVSDELSREDKRVQGMRPSPASAG